MESIINISGVNVDAGTNHGRILVLDRDGANESTGHVSPLPTLVQGGRGRARGGEELCGIRGVLQYMQRSRLSLPGQLRPLKKDSACSMPLPP